MTSAGLRREAEARGVSATYRDWAGRAVRVGDATLAAILDALDAPSGPPPSGPPPPPPGAAPEAGGAHRAPPPPPGRTWGFAVQLYGLRSRRSWGHGDFADLADLAAWSAGELGAGFVLINPLHAPEPLPPISPSPYLPMSRRYLSPLYLRIEDIPEYTALPAADKARIRALSAPLRARSSTSDLIDRDEVWQAKRAALEIIWARPLNADRQACFERFRAREGRDLRDWETWCALAEEHGADWRAWPAELRSARSHREGDGRGRRGSRAAFHAWLAWLTDSQLAAAQAAAREAGMVIGVVSDLAVGAHPGGADAWAHADTLVRGMSVGAPPDEFNQLGQDWGQPPWHPGRLAAAGCQPLASLLRASFARAGALRVDHVTGLFRLWWVPDGMTPDQGAYVRYDHRATVGTLTAEAARAGALAIGEDLGTVEPWMRDYLAAQGVLGTPMLWFERTASGLPLPPGRWRRASLATVGTHDVPPAAAFVTGEQVELRARLGLLTRAVEAERAGAAADLAAWRDALRSAGVLRAGQDADPGAFVAGLYRYLARTPSALVGVSLADAVGDRRPANLPGTTSEYPNWQVPLCDGEGRAVLLEDLPDIPGVRALALAVS